jgi:uncharacterized protein DUF1203
MSAGSINFGGSFGFAQDRRRPPLQKKGDGYSGIRCPNSVDAQRHFARLATLMKTSNFRVVPLRTDVAEAARRAAASSAPDHRVVTVDSLKGYPCRHCLRWAKPDERVILFPFAAIPSGHPYAESGPVFVHEESCERYASTTDFPADFRNGRVFRAYTSNYDMIDAEVVNGSEPEAVVEKLLQSPETAFVDARSVTRGCFTFRMERI